MSPTQKKRLFFYTGMLILAAVIVGLIIYALSQNMNAYYTPVEIIEATRQNSKLMQKNIRLGGMVKLKSLQRSANLKVEFIVTDYKQDLKVVYQGILPDLFREGQGIIAEGRFASGKFMANRILAKHDETYMPENIKKRIGTSS